MSTPQSSRIVCAGLHVTSADILRSLHIERDRSTFYEKRTKMLESEIEKMKAVLAEVARDGDNAARGGVMGKLVLHTATLQRELHDSESEAQDQIASLTENVFMIEAALAASEASRAEAEAALEVIAVAHAVAEAAHELAEAAHETAEAAHETAEAAHETAKATHETAEAAHETAEAAHETAEATRATTVAIHAITVAEELMRAGVGAGKSRHSKTSGSRSRKSSA